MTSICACCAACLASLGQADGDHCGVHRSEIRAERPEVGFSCHHDHQKKPRPASGTARRKKRK